MLAAGGVKRLSAAVFVAQKMEGTGAARKPVARTDDEIQKLKRIVQSALGIQENDPNRKDEITLEQIPFNDQPALDLSERLQTDTTRQLYWDIARNGLFALLALAVLIIFLRLLKKTSNEITQGELLGQLDQLNAARRESAKPGGMVTVEALNALIRDNPASVGQAVRSWLGTGANKQP
jgi:flagellar biosynthesis/type III secretory pathway M-ring protein FliF/YscJ